MSKSLPHVAAGTPSTVEVGKLPQLSTVFVIVTV